MRPSQVSVAMVWKKIKRDREAALESWDKEIQRWAVPPKYLRLLGHSPQSSNDPPPED